MEAVRAERLRRKAAALALAAEPSRNSLMAFTKLTSPTYQSGWFNEEVCEKLEAFLEAVARKESPRLMVFAPPRHGKSELVSRKFPAFALGKHPDLSIIATSYSADLASRMNRDVQRVIDSEEYAAAFPATALWGSRVRSVAQGTWLRNSDIFEVVGHAGAYRSAGVGGGITGMGGDIVIIDDPIKDAEQAGSETYRDKVWDWYTSTLYTRQSPGAGILLIMTRWNEDDLAGRLLKAQEAGGDKWEVVRYPAIAETDEAHRAKGEALHPERYSLDRLVKIMAAVGSYVWAALYQQRPGPRDGGLFKRHWWKIVEAAAPAVARVRAWDLAGTQKKAGNNPDWTAGVRMMRASDGLFYVEGVRRLQGSPGEVVNLITGCAATDPQPSTVRIPQDPGQAGKYQAENLIKALAGYNVKALPVTGDKETRARPAAVQVEAGNLRVLKTGDPDADAWIEPFLNEVCSFPSGSHDDQVDALADAFNELAIPMDPAAGYLEIARRQLAAKAAANQPAIEKPYYAPGSMEWAREQAALKQET